MKKEEKSSLNLNQGTSANEVSLSKSRKKLPVLVVAVTACAVILIVCILYNNSPSVKASRQLHLGDNYLNNKQYEESVVAFKLALEFDPDNVDAKEQMADAYIKWSENNSSNGNYEDAAKVISAAVTDLPETDFTSTVVNIYKGWAELYLSQNDTESAYKVLDEGRKLLGTGDSSLDSVYGEVDQQVLEELSDEIQTALNADEQGGHEYSLGGYKNTSKYFTENAAKLKDTLFSDSNSYIDENKGIGYYLLSDGSLGIYIGGYTDGLRNGTGIWLNSPPHNDDDTEVFERFEGGWVNDVPVGTQQYSNGSGTVYCAVAVDEDGLWDGDVDLTHKGTTFRVRYYHGKVLPIKTFSVRNSVPAEIEYVDPGDLDDYISQLQGDVGLLIGYVVDSDRKIYTFSSDFLIYMNKALYKINYQ